MERQPLYTFAERRRFLRAYIRVGLHEHDVSDLPQDKWTDTKNLLGVYYLTDAPDFRIAEAYKMPLDELNRKIYDGTTQLYLSTPTGIRNLFTFRQVGERIAMSMEKPRPKEKQNSSAPSEKDKESSFDLRRDFVREAFEEGADKRDPIRTKFSFKLDWNGVTKITGAYYLSDIPTRELARRLKTTPFNVVYISMEGVIELWNISPDWLKKKYPVGLLKSKIVTSEKDPSLVVYDSFRLDIQRDDPDPDIQKNDEGLLAEAIDNGWITQGERRKLLEKDEIKLLKGLKRGSTLTPTQSQILSLLVAKCVRLGL